MKRHNTGSHPSQLPTHRKGVGDLPGPRSRSRHSPAWGLRSVGAPATSSPRRCACQEPPRPSAEVLRLGFFFVMEETPRTFSFLFSDGLTRIEASPLLMAHLKAALPTLCRLNGKRKTGAFVKNPASANRLHMQYARPSCFRVGETETPEMRCSYGHNHHTAAPFHFTPAIFIVLIDSPGQFFLVLSSPPRPGENGNSSGNLFRMFS